MINNTDDLRKILSEVITGVRDGTIDLDKAKAINELSRTIIDTARVEIDHMKVTGDGSSGFLSGSDTPLLEQTGNGTRKVTTLPNGLTVTQHKMRG